METYLNVAAAVAWTALCWNSCHKPLWDIVKYLSGTIENAQPSTRVFQIQVVKNHEAK